MEGTQIQESATYALPDKDVATAVMIGKGDRLILKTYKNLLRRPMRAVLHAMIGQSVKCWEEKHDEYIEMLEERQRIQLRIVLAYLRKYGPISPQENR